MRKTKYLLLIMLLALVALIFMPNTSNAAVSAERTVLANDGSMKFKFSGLTLDTTHEYQFGIENTSIAEVAKWFKITEFTATTADVNINMSDSNQKAVFSAGDKGYITIKDLTSGSVIVKSYEVNLKIPYLRLTNFSVVNNGRKFDNHEVRIAARYGSSPTAYYQYEKITDQNVINKYKEIKGGDIYQLENLLKTTLPSDSNWKKWNTSSTIYGASLSGQPVTTVSVLENGLYYLWVYVQQTNAKSLYGYILVDNLENEIALTSISLPSTKEVELGKTLTLTPTFNPSNTTDKTVTWTSSDESVAIVNSNGVVTPKKVGSTIITVTSNVGKKTAKCTVTVKSSSSTTTDGWTDTSNIKIKITDIINENLRSFKISIEGITTNKDSQYYLYLTNGKNKPTLSVTDSNFINKGYYTSQNGTTFQNYYQTLTNEGEEVLEKNGDIYAWIVESQKNSDNKRENKFILEGYKVERPALLKLGVEARFSVYINEKYTHVFNWNANHTNNRERKLKVKIGTIDDNSILKALKNNEPGALEKLLTYSKSAKSIYTGTLPMGESASIVDKIGIVKGQYYYAYFELDDENGKYYPIEDVMGYQGYINQDEKGLYDFYDTRFTWNIDDNNNNSTSTPTDTTITPDKKLPQTGEKIAIIGTIGIAVVVTIVLGIKAKKYNF